MPRYEGNYLLLTHGMALMKIPFDASESKKGVPLLVKPFMTATGIDVDCLRGKVSHESFFILALYRRLRLRHSSYTLVKLETVLPSCFLYKVYWTDTTGKSIRRSNYDGTQTEIFLDRDLQFPEGLSVDWLSRNLYFTDSGKRTIELINIDTMVRRVIVEDYLKNPRGIAVHPTLG